VPRERLQKYIANCGHCSRRKAELLIEAGLVQVDGVVVRELGAKVDPGRSDVRIQGERVLPPSKRTIALHKPAGFITSTHDTHERLTVMDLLPRSIAETGVLPAGRLDLETEGLLILTNDGDLQHRITHPRYECAKEYHVELDRAPTGEELARLSAGIFLAELGRTTSPAEIAGARRCGSGSARG
jgi:23S rRNA pseudouridine2605 synthase